MKQVQWSHRFKTAYYHFLVTCLVGLAKTIRIQSFPCFSTGVKTTIPGDYSFNGRLDFQGFVLHKLDTFSFTKVTKARRRSRRFWKNRLNVWSQGANLGWTVPGSGGLIVHDVFPRWKRGRMWITWWYHDIMFDILYDLYEWKQCLRYFNFNIYLIGLRECGYGWWMVVWKCSVTKNATLENPPNSWGLFFSTIWHPLENLGAYTFVLYHLFFFKLQCGGPIFLRRLALKLKSGPFTEAWKKRHLTWKW